MRNATLVLLIAVFAGVSSASGQDITLRYHWVKGDEVRYRTSVQGGSTMSGLPGVGDMTMEISMTMVMRMSVQDVAADGAATLRETFESIRVEQLSPAGRTVFDSASGEKPTDQTGVALGSYMSAMVGESLTVETGADGATRKIEGMSAIFDKMLKTLPPGPASALTADQFKGFMSDDGIRALVGQGISTFPDRPLKTGETWVNESEQTIPLLGTVSSTRTFTVSGVENRNGVSFAHIAVRVATRQTTAATSASPGVSAAVGNTESAGEIVFDVTRGRLQQSSMRSEMPMDLTVPQAAGEPMHLKGVTRNVMTMEIVEK